MYKGQKYKNIMTAALKHAVLIIRKKLVWQPRKLGLTIDQVKVGLKHCHVSRMWNTPPLICISLNNNSDHYGECFFLQSTPTYVNDVAVYCPIELIPLLCVLHKRIFLKD